jgi:hypothetical protein
MSTDPSPRPRWAVAIVSGGSSLEGGEVAGGLAGWGWPIVLVYLDYQALAEATVADIIAGGGTTVAVRADLVDDLDIRRLFTESSAAFGHVDAVVHMTAENVVHLYEQAAQFVREHGVIVSTVSSDPIPPRVAAQLRRRGIAVGRVPAEAVLAFLDTWRHQSIG